jgi:hydroxymethylpyrimidine pyrophosphatase-like HAD family hydrolase
LRERIMPASGRRHLIRRRRLREGGLMPYYFRAVAMDFDGTIAHDDRVNPRALAAAAELRRRGRHVILCTGRIMSELRAVFPQVDRCFDAIVAENGAVLALPGRSSRCTVEPLPAELRRRLSDEGVPVRSGDVLLATTVEHSVAVLEAIRDLGIDAQIVHNRSELMVLPSGVNKATGLGEALAELHVSKHSTIAIGDAENDHALLHCCAVGVAVANAVPALKAAADVLLDGENGEAVADFLLGPVLSGELRVAPDRWRIELGEDAEQEPVTIPGSRTNVLLAGGSGTGKSYMAGLLVERLVQLGFTTCVFDAEGDHVGLDVLRGTLVVGGADPLPGPAQLARIIRNRFTSVIVDLSLLDYDAKRSYVQAALAELMAMRRTSGLPHWIVLEEADQLMAETELPAEAPHLKPLGFCLITHRAAVLPQSTLACMDAVIALGGAEQWAQSAPPGGMERPFVLADGEALLAAGAQVRRFRTAGRLTPHVRHQSKYTNAYVPEHARFYFHEPAARTAGNVREFCSVLADLPGDSLGGHLQAGDFSRWVREVLADDELGARLRSVERWYRTNAGLDLMQLREAVISAVEARYPQQPQQREQPQRPVRQERPLRPQGLR